MRETDPNEACDDALREAFGASTFPPTPQLEPIVRRRLDRARSMKRWGIGLSAAAAFAVAVVIWQRTPGNAVPSADRSESQIADAGANDLPVSAVLFAAPPVDSLDLLAEQQAAYVAALQEM